MATQARTPTCRKVATAGLLALAREQERQRIGRELHDHVSQMLALLAIRIDQLRSEGTTPPRLAAALEELRQTTSEIAADVHGLSHRLHGVMLEQDGLAPALQRLVGEVTARYDILIDLSLAPLPRDLNAQVRLCLFRVAEESLMNVAKHSRAASARVHLRCGSDDVHLTIEDAGVGFEIRRRGRRQGLGLVSMRERLHGVGGDIRVESAPLRGTRVEAWVPRTAR